MIRKLHFGAIISFLTFLIMVGVMLSGVVYGAPQYPDTLSAYSALEKQMWTAGCRRTEPELAEAIDIKVYQSSAGTISGIANVKIRAKCIFYPISAPIMKPPVIEPGRIKLEWDAPTTRLDGTALLPGQIAGYQIYMDGVMTGYTSALLFELQAAPGKHKFELRTIDTQGLPSPFSPPLELVAR